MSENFKPHKERNPVVYRIGREIGVKNIFDGSNMTYLYTKCDSVNHWYEQEEACVDDQGKLIYAISRIVGEDKECDCDEANKGASMWDLFR